MNFVVGLNADHRRQSAEPVYGSHSGDRLGSIIDGDWMR